MFFGISKIFPQPSRAATGSFSSHIQMFPRNSRYRPKYASKANKLEPDKSFCYRGGAIDHASLYVKTFV